MDASQPNGGASLCSFSLHPPILPRREAITGFSPEGIKQKIRWKTIGPFVVPPQGLEPWTPTLRVSCSTN